MVMSNEDKKSKKRVRLTTFIYKWLQNKIRVNNSLIRLELLKCSLEVPVKSLVIGSVSDSSAQYSIV